jgi:hypothetical protein
MLHLGSLGVSSAWDLARDVKPLAKNEQRWLRGDVAVVRERRKKYYWKP